MFKRLKPYIFALLVIASLGAGITRIDFVPLAAVKITHSDGSVTPYYGITDAGRGTALTSAFAALVSGDRLDVGTGNYTNITTAWTPPADVEIVGQAGNKIVYGDVTGNASFDLLTLTHNNQKVRGLHIDGNSSTNVTNLQCGIVADGATKFTISGNYVENLGDPSRASCMAIVVRQNNGNTVDGLIENNFTCNTIDGINCTGGTYLTIAHNHVTSTCGDIGVNLVGSSFCNVSENYLYEIGGSGIRLSNAADNIISANHIFNCSRVTNGVEDCIRLSGSASSRNVIVGNVCRKASSGNTTNVGILIGVNCADNIVRNNSVNDSGVNGSISNSGTNTWLGGNVTTTGTSDAISVGAGGTGATTLTGLVKGNGTSPFTAASAGTDYVAPSGALGTPSSGTLTNCTGLPVSGTTGYGTGIATLLATPSSANFAAACTDETGSGALMFGTSPTIGTQLTVTGGTVVASTPTLNTTQTINNGAVNFTGWKQTITNTANAGTSLLIDQVVGSTSVFNVGLDGTATTRGTVNVNNGSNIEVQLAGTTGIFMASDHTLGWNSVTSGAGGLFANGYKDTIFGHGTKTLTESTATSLARISVSSGAGVGGTLHYQIYATDGTDFQTRMGSVNFAIVNKGGTLTAAVGTVSSESVAASTGTLTVSFDTNSGASNTMDIRANAVSSLTQTTLTCKWWIDDLGSAASGSPTPTITAQ